MRVLILGAGRVGSLVASDLSKDYEVWVVDRDEGRLALLKGFANTVRFDASSPEGVAGLAKGFDLIVNALPGHVGFRVLKALVSVGRPVVDVSFMPEDPLVLDEEVRRAGTPVVVDAGFAPGLSNMFVGRAQALLKHLKNAVILVGGLPKEPKPPLYHQVLFSPNDLMEEYVRPARMVKGGEVVEVDPLSIIKEVEVGGFRLECFPSDGLRTLLRTVKAESMSEWTLRWPGHLSRMRVLKELGFLRRENLPYTLKVITPLMTYESPDMSLMEVRCEGLDGRELRYTLYDEASGGVTSMARVTGFTAAAIARLVLRGEAGAGINPPEVLGMREDTFEYVVSELRVRGVRLESSVHGT